MNSVSAASETPDATESEPVDACHRVHPAVVMDGSVHSVCGSRVSHTAYTVAIQLQSTKPKK